MPPEIVAACFPVSIPLPPASNPINLTALSSINGWKIPIAFEPPPTHASTASGNFPVNSRTCALASTPIILWKSRTIVGNGCGPASVPSH